MLSDSTLLDYMDGSIRDLASLRGTYRIISVTTDATLLLFDVRKHSEIDFVDFGSLRPIRSEVIRRMSQPATTHFSATLS